MGIEGGERWPGRGPGLKTIKRATWSLSGGRQDGTGSAMAERVRFFPPPSLPLWTSCWKAVRPLRETGQTEGPLTPFVPTASGSR